MLSEFWKKFLQKHMMSSAPDSPTAEMNSAKVEDLDFQGLPADGKSPEQRADDILAAMTLDEKIDFVSGTKSLGVKGLPRLGLPSVWMSDATSGARSYGPATAFPSAVAMAASWDPEAVAVAADHIAETARAKGIKILLAPGINIARVPTCGRNFEYMGEDPFLAGKLVSAYVKACTKRNLLCTVKHLAANNSDYDRHKVSSDVDERSLRELYLPAFEASVKDGKTKAIMSSYNPINGTWASENRWLLTDVLRNEWGFDGIVVSDWNSLYSTAGPMTAGLDLEMPKAKWLSSEKVKAALASGDASEVDLDAMVKRLLKTFFAAGTYDEPTVDLKSREFAPEHDEAALAAARQGLVLLKNNNDALPLPEGKGVTIAVCGPWAEEASTMGGGSCHVARTTGTVTLADGMDMTAADGTVIVRIPWDDKGRLTDAGKKAISDADAVVAACGFNYIAESELYDRPWRLPKAQRKLIEEASNLNKRTAVVLTAGGGVETESWVQQVPSLVHGLYLGQTVGTATAEMLFGRFSPSGKLPFTMARRWNDIAAVKNYPNRFWTASLGRMILGQGNPKFRRMRHWNYAEGLMVGYRHFDTSDIDPAFAFGHGLSYTRFEISDPKLSTGTIGPDDDLKVKVNVKNTGNFAGAEVVQVYVADPVSRLPRPAKELKGFAKAYLEPGKSKTVEIVLPPRSFRYWDPEASNGKGSWVAEPGEFEILVGNSSRNITCKASVKLN